MNAEAIVATVALVVSLGVALWQFLAARSWHRAEQKLQRRMAELEEERRVDELRPQLEATWVREPDGYAVDLVNMGPSDLDEVGWSFRVDHAAHPLMALGPARQAAGVVAPMTVGGRSRLEALITVDGPAKGDVHLRCECRAGDRSWITTVKFEAKRPGRVSAF